MARESCGGRGAETVYLYLCEGCFGSSFSREAPMC